MLTVKMLFLSLTIIFLYGINTCNAAVSCVVCQAPIYINITTDTDINTDGCSLEADDICTLILRIDYMNSSNNIVLFSGSKESILVLTNGEPQVTETTSIWFNEFRVQRLANIICFAGTSCGLDTMKQIYKDDFRSFDYQTIQNRLTEQLYSPTASTASLTCADSSGSSISCSDGFCRTMFDATGRTLYSSCVKKSTVASPYGLVVSKTIMSDLGGEQSIVIFTCNKPMCNSNENTQQVFQQLVAAQIFPKPTITTTTPPRSMGIKMGEKQEKLVIMLWSLFLIFKF